MVNNYSSSSMQAFSAPRDLDLRQSPTIVSMEKLIADSEGLMNEHRQKTFDTATLIADAWQILVRAGESQLAKAIDGVAKEIFLSCWNAITVEVFMCRRPERRSIRVKDTGGEDSSEISTTDQGNDDSDPAKTVSGDDTRHSEAVDSAQRQIAKAWDILEGLDQGGGEHTDGEAIRFLGMACFGETHFRAAMVEARLCRLRQADEV